MAQCLGPLVVLAEAWDLIPRTYMVAHNLLSICNFSPSAVPEAELGGLLPPNRSSQPG